MARDDEAPAALPKLLGGRYRPRRLAPDAAAENAATEQTSRGVPEAYAARDTVLDRDLELVRVPFGEARLAERDAYIDALKARTTVLAPALIAVHDAGSWDDDAFVVLEQVPSLSPLAEVVSSRHPSLEVGLRWAAALLEAASVLDAAALALEPAEWAAAGLDAYDVPRVRGLERAQPADASSREATVRALGALLERLAPGEVAAAEQGDRDRFVQLARDAASGSASLTSLRTAVGALRGVPEPERPLLHADVGPAGPHERRVLMAGIAVFVLAFVVLIVVLVAAR